MPEDELDVIGVERVPDRVPIHLVKCVHAPESTDALDIELVGIVAGYDGWSDHGLDLAVRSAPVALEPDRAIDVPEDDLPVPHLPTEVINNGLLIARERLVLDALGIVRHQLIKELGVGVPSCRSRGKKTRVAP